MYCKNVGKEFLNSVYKLVWFVYNMYDYMYVILYIFKIFEIFWYMKFVEVSLN